MKPIYTSIREKVNAPARQYDLFERKPARAHPFVPVYLRGEAEENEWWARVWAERGLPDPADVSIDEFRAALAWGDVRPGGAVVVEVGER